MKKIYPIAALLLAILALLAACSSMTSDDIAAQDQQQAEASGLTIHKIGVPSYNTSDAEVMIFKGYLDNYIKGCFEDVTFIYSDTLEDSEDMASFLESCADQGVEGIFAFVSYDLKAEVDFCAENDMYYIRPSGTVDDESFESVEDNPYYLGEIGPGSELEYEAARKMTEAMAAAGDGQSYVVLSGGSILGNEMHRLRTVAVLETLENIYGVSFDQAPEELSMVEETTVLTAGDLRVAICPGYMDYESYGEEASKVISSGEYDVVLSSLPVAPLIDALQSVDIRCGVIDCFSDDNYFGFQKGKIAYVAGKYQSEIGPAFAALYNAITGNADLYRVDGKAFRLKQGFWTAANKDEYNERFALASSLSVNAYNYEDLYSIIKSLNPDASFSGLQALVEAYSYEDCLARRGE